ncbi:MAG: Integral rane sensor signal transduction histidine kinase [Chthoniobacteraceae bacterium]|nr:Integral rane sensor signal transduction histidine kinase [Chthoniobacteraceae bacterium]
MSHEIKPKQLRALLLLLVLVPLIPTVLMIRFVIDAIDSERTAVIERTSNAYGQTLLRADAALGKQNAAHDRPWTAPEILAHYKSLLDPQVAVRVVDENGRFLAGDFTIREGHSTRIAKSILHEVSLPWSVEVWLIEKTFIDESLRDHVVTYSWMVGISIVAIFSIATAAAAAVQRQLTLDQLKNTSVATVAHELRTPLASMRMLVDTLRQGRYRGPNQLQEYLDLIASENLRLSRLTDNFLTLSRLERNPQALQLQPLSPGHLAEDAVQLLHSRLHEPGVQFELLLEEPLPELAADRDAMLTVLSNLLDNALKYSADPKQISLRVASETASVIFSVTDNGIGIARADRRRIFDPFHQVDQKLTRSRQGCGLGLSLVSQIVAAHGGRTTLVSEPGKGSTFSVSLPSVS